MVLISSLADCVQHTSKSFSTFYPSLTECLFGAMLRWALVLPPAILRAGTGLRGKHVMVLPSATPYQGL